MTVTTDIRESPVPERTFCQVFYFAPLRLAKAVAWCKAGMGWDSGGCNLPGLVLHGRDWTLEDGACDCFSTVDMLVMAGLKRLAVALFGGIAATIGLMATKPNSVITYRMDVYFDTPFGPKSGHAIREITRQRAGGFIFGEGKPQWNLRGEAIEVEIMPGKSIFALLVNQKGQYDFASRNIWYVLKANPSVESDIWPVPPSNLRPSFSLSELTPLFVEFTDIKDASTIKMIKPEDFRGNYGEGYALKRITVIEVDQSITKTIQTRLPWLGSIDAILPPSFRRENVPGLPIRRLFLEGHK